MVGNGAGAASERGRMPHLFVRPLLCLLLARVRASPRGEGYMRHDLGVPGRSGTLISHGKSVWFGTLLAAASALGCGGVDYLRAESAGHVGCEPEEIVISDSRRRAYSRTWIAACRDRVFTCTANERQTACAERVGPEP